MSSARLPVDAASTASRWAREFGRGSSVPAAHGAANSPGARVLLLVGGDETVRLRLRDCLTASRWRVAEAVGGAAAMACLDELRPEALLVDGWLPDLEIGEFLEYVRAVYPRIDILSMDGAPLRPELVSSRRLELQQTLREAFAEPEPRAANLIPSSLRPFLADALPKDVFLPTTITTPAVAPRADELLPEMVGASVAMEELGRMVRLVAPRSTTVLIEGETGTGKELVAKAVHRLSKRANKPLVVLNCAAIPEALLEAELFGHTRGAFTGAVRSRTGRIEAADGGTLFLDEIGEMPLALQAKMLRFLECGELQRVGENEPSYVDVRVIAATHQPLERRAEEQTFRLDLYHRLAVFPIEVPSLLSRMEDLPVLARHFLSMLSHGATPKRLQSEAMDRLEGHAWPGNVRELMHVLERALILSGSKPEIEAEDIRIRKRDRSL